MKMCLANPPFSRLASIIISTVFNFAFCCSCACADSEFDEYIPFSATTEASPAEAPVKRQLANAADANLSRVFEHHAPAPEIGRIGDREDIPFLTPYPGSILIGGVRKLGPLDLTILGTSGTDAPVAGTAVISRNYNGPLDLSRLQFIRENLQAFNRAGWTVHYPAGPDSDSGIIIAHYDKDSMDVWARLTYEDGAELTYLTTDPSPDDWKTMLRTKCRLPLYGIIFDFNKATLRPESAPVLDRTARLLSEDPALIIEIQGHTDNVGNDDYNLKLSDARAGTVRQWLIEHRVDAGRLTSVGYGKRVPVADNKTDFGRAKNRRVELKRRDCKPAK